MLWEQVMNNCPMMKKLIESKINQEVSNKNAEIEQLKQDKKMLQEQIDNLSLVILAKVGDSNA